MTGSPWPFEPRTPSRCTAETVAALSVTVVGAGLGGARLCGAVAFVVPWTRSRLLRHGIAAVIAVIPLAIAIWYIAKFTTGW